MRSMTLTLAVSKNILSRRWAIFMSTLVLIILLAGSIFWASNKQLFHLTTEQPFTELYFANSLAVPTKFTVGQQYKIPFVITNRSQSVKKYTFQVTLLSHNQTRSLPVETITVREGEATYQQAVFTAEDKGPITLSVALPDENQAITLKMGQ